MESEDEGAGRDCVAHGEQVDSWFDHDAPVDGTAARLGLISVDVERARLRLLDIHRQAESLLGAWMVQARILINLDELGDRLAAATPANAAAPRRDTRAWESCRTALVLSDRCAEAIVGRAARWHVDAGGRFQAVGSSILLWSGTRQGRGRGQGPRIMAFAVLERQCPAPGQATVTHLAWKPGLGGSAAVMWQALEVLAGGPLSGRDDSGRLA